MVLSQEVRHVVRSLAQNVSVVGVVGSGPSLDINKLKDCDVILASNGALVEVQGLFDSKRIIWVVSTPILAGVTENSKIKRQYLKGSQAHATIAYTRQGIADRFSKIGIRKTGVRFGTLLSLAHDRIWKVAKFRWSLLYLMIRCAGPLVLWLLEFGYSKFSFLTRAPFTTPWPPDAFRPSTGVMAVIIANEVYPNSRFVLSGIGDFGQGYSAGLVQAGATGSQNHSIVDRLILNRLRLLGKQGARVRFIGT